jgi:RNA polymerase sigma-70 factor (ECF subfamily)
MGTENLATDFASVYRTYRRRVYFQCFCMLHNQSDAEDAAQEVFLQLFRKAHTFRGESSFSTWLHRLTTNCVLMEIRRKRHRGFEATHQEASLGAGVRNDVLDPRQDSFQAPSTPIFDRVSLGAAMSRLPQGYQRIFELHDVEGYTHEEIAGLLGIKGGTSKSQLHKARLRMRRLLQTSGDGAENQQFGRSESDDQWEAMRREGNRQSKLPR